MAAEEDHATKSELWAVHEQLSFEIRANGIKLEQMDSKIDAVIEALGTLATKADLAKIDELSDRIARLESAVRTNSADLRKNGDDVLKHGEDIRAFGTEVAQLRLQFDRRDLRGDELERRIAEIEKRAGIRR